MKRLSIVLLLLALPLCLHAGFGMQIVDGHVVASAPAGLSCTTSDDAALVTINTGAISSTVADEAWRYQEIVLTSRTRITEIILSISDGSGTGDFVVSAFTNNAGVPGTEIANTSITVSADNIPATQSDVSFIPASPIELDPGTYQIVARGSGATPYFAWYGTDTNPYAGGSGYSSDAGVTWVRNVTPDDTHDRRMTIMGCQ